MAGSDTSYTIEWHHGGKFVSKNRKREYVDGQVSYETGVDADETSLIEVKNYMTALGYGGVYRVWCKMHKKSLARGLKLLSTDKDVHEVFLDHNYCKRVVLYVEHSVEEAEVLEN